MAFLSLSSELEPLAPPCSFSGFTISNIISSHLRSTLSLSYKHSNISISGGIQPKDEYHDGKTKEEPIAKALLGV